MTEGVNALNRAMLISTFERIWKHAPEENLCQCPQSGDAHFYVRSVAYTLCRRGSVSMPLIGRYSFLRNATCVERKNPFVVSMPSIGRYSFLLLKFLCMCEIHESCVNALNRAILISTLPLWNRLI